MHEPCKVCALPRAMTRQYTRLTIALCTQEVYALSNMDVSFTIAVNHVWKMDAKVNKCVLRYTVLFTVKVGL